MDFSCKQKDSYQRRTRFFGDKCPSTEINQWVASSQLKSMIVLPVVKAGKDGFG